MGLSLSSRARILVCVKVINMTELFDKKDVLSWSNADKVEIGKEGYFTNIFSYDLTAWKKGRLINIDTQNRVSFVFVNSSDSMYYGLFLPSNKVKNRKKIYRPFKNYDEFTEKTKLSVNDIIHIETDHFPQFTDYRTFFHMSILGYTDDKLILPTPFYDISFYELFKYVNFVNDNGELIPFGVIDES